MAKSGFPFGFGVLPEYVGCFQYRPLEDRVDVVFMEDHEGKSTIPAGSFPRQRGEEVDIKKVHEVIAEYYLQGQLHGIKIHYEIYDEGLNPVDGGIVQGLR